MQAAQVSAGVPIADTSSVLNYTEQTYLKRAIASLPNCTTLPSPSSLTDIDLERAAAMPLVNITQGSTNMCSSFAFAQAYTIKHALQNMTSSPLQLSPPYAYFFQRVEECQTTGTCPCPSCKDASCTSCSPPCVDCGSYIQSALTVFTNGVCDSSAWPLTQPMNVPPSATALEAATRAITSWTCITPNSIMRALQNNNPVVVQLMLTPASVTWMQSLINYASSTPIETDDAVKFPGASPSSTSAPLAHVVVIVGYVTSTKRFLVRNSFGFQWGSRGRFTIQDTDMTPTNINQAIQIQTVK